MTQSVSRTLTIALVLQEASHVVLVIKNVPANAGDAGDAGSGRFLGVENSNSLQCSCLGNPTGQRSLAGNSPWGHKESDTTEHTYTHTSATKHLIGHYAF